MQRGNGGLPREVAKLLLKITRIPAVRYRSEMSSPAGHNRSYLHPKSQGSSYSAINKISLIDSVKCIKRESLIRFPQTSHPTLISMKGCFKLPSQIKWTSNLNGPILSKNLNRISKNLVRGNRLFRKHTQTTALKKTVSKEDSFKKVPLNTSLEIKVPGITIKNLRRSAIQSRVSANGNVKLRTNNSVKQRVKSTIAERPQINIGEMHADTISQHKINFARKMLITPKAVDGVNSGRLMKSEAAANRKLATSEISCKFQVVVKLKNELKL
eukprot:TRINITY_DN24253_c0_g1_i1.p1 TRINITY_DN24253_c0_g1~~TRINITY_DN24253_c0_g1_i1.p1  ORF type:complete len:270 (-),score=38.94 TRINITY_DN24253_c0_g1_i1:135-944(-)